jgi:hypothetical protein
MKGYRLTYFRGKLIDQQIHTVSQDTAVDREHTMGWMVQGLNTNGGGRGGRFSVPSRMAWGAHPAFCIGGTRFFLR